MGPSSGSGVTGIPLQKAPPPALVPPKAVSKAAVPTTGTPGGAAPNSRIPDRARPFSRTQTNSEQDCRPQPQHGSRASAAKSSAAGTLPTLREFLASRYGKVKRGGSTAGSQPDWEAESLQAYLAPEGWRIPPEGFYNIHDAVAVGIAM